MNALSSLQQVSDCSSGLFNMYQSVREDTQLQISGWNAVLRNCHGIIGLALYSLTPKLHPLVTWEKGLGAKINPTCIVFLDGFILRPYLL